MSRTEIGVLVLALLAIGLVVAMRAGWRHRAAAAVGLAPLPAVPPSDLLGTLRCGPLEATYVATTTAGDWLDRVVAHRLGERSAATVTVHDAGVLVARGGAPDLFVPAADLREVTRAPGMAGKVVGGDGLVVLRWALGGTLLDTGLRTRRAADRATLTEAVRGLPVPGPGHPSPTTPTAGTPGEERP